jgi:hypothetical protein
MTAKRRTRALSRRASLFTNNIVNSGLAAVRREAFRPIQRLDKIFT